MNEDLRLLTNQLLAYVREVYGLRYVNWNASVALAG